MEPNTCTIAKIASKAGSLKLVMRRKTIEVMVLEAGQECRCVLVDDLVGKQEVVIKSLGETFRDQQEFAGAAILGDGRVGLILDTTALVRLKLKHGEAA